MKSRFMTAILVIIIILLVMAFAERESNSKSNPKGYSIRYGSVSYIVITPLDRKSSVLITKRGTHDNDLVLEGIPAQIVSIGAKIIARKPDNDRNVRKLVKRMVIKRAQYLAEKKAKNKISTGWLGFNR